MHEYSKSIRALALLAANTSRPVVLFEANIIAKRILDICRTHGISITCVCDQSAYQSAQQFEGLEVLSLETLHARFPRALLLIASVQVRAAIADIQRSGFQEFYLGGLLLDSTAAEQVPGALALDWEKYQYEVCRQTHEAFAANALFVRSAEIIITERCSLKCKDCSNLMQYYESPQHCDVDLVLRSMKKFFSVVDDVIEFRILGGEPFLNQEWPSVVRSAVSEAKVRRVVVITNGTIVPKHEGWECLQDPKVRLNISNYGAHSRRFSQLIDFAETNRIRYWVYTAESWNDCAQVRNYHRTPEENVEVFRTCWSKNIWTTLSDGKLYRCPYSANLERLRATPPFPYDSINLLMDDISETELKGQVEEFLLNKGVLGSCGFCSGVVLDRNVPPALQTRRPLPYERFGVIEY